MKKSHLRAQNLYIEDIYFGGQAAIFNSSYKSTLEVLKHFYFKMHQTFKKKSKCISQLF